MRPSAAHLGTPLPVSHSMNGVVIMAMNRAISSGTIMVLAALRPAITITSEAKTSSTRVPVLDMISILAVIVLATLACRLQRISNSDQVGAYRP